MKNENAAVYELDSYRKQNANLLIPDIKIDALSEYHKPVVEKVHLSPDPDAGDVYFDNGAKGLVVSGKGLSKLAVCAGVIWNIEQTRRTDDRRDKLYCSYQAVGGIKKPDGTIVWMKSEYDIDLEVLKDQLVEKYTTKAREEKKDQGWIDYCVNRDWEQKRTHKIKLCETGSKNRVIRALLGLKSKYTPEELKRPFVMARIVFQPDYSDPEVKRMMLAAAIQSITGVYGPPAAPQIEEPYIDVSHETIDDVFTPEPDEIPDPEYDYHQPTGKENQRLDFQNQRKEDQIKTLKELMKKTNYFESKLTRPLNEFSEEHRVMFFDKLSEMLNDDIPY